MDGKSGKSDIGELRTYYKGLTLPQKKEFINNLKKKIQDLNTPKYNNFLAECVKDYNAAIENQREAQKEAQTSSLSDEVFAKAIATMLSAPKAEVLAPKISTKILGRWQREAGGKIYYYDFNLDGSFETNEVPGHEVLKGHYATGVGGSILMEPHDLLRFSSLFFSPSGNSMTIGYTDGTSYEYTHQQ